MLSDFFTVFYWWLILFLGGASFFPWIFYLGKRFWDKGWIFAKIAWILTLSYLIFFLARIHFLPFMRESLFLLILFLFAGVVFFLKKEKRRKEIRLFLKERKGIIFLEEEIFFFALFFWSFIRGFQPRIEGLEKFMDFGFVNSILRSLWFPPADMWFAGGKINYYYFGHLQAAVLTKLSGLDSALTYNLMIATIFALVFSATFSLAANLIFLFRSRQRPLSQKINLKPLILTGLISAFLLTLGGNLHALIYSIKDGPQHYWYPDATRFIGYRPNNPNDKTIHEFPSYSFVVSDLHGHLNDIPTVLLFLALLLVFLFRWREKKERFWLRVALSFLLALMYMTNSWDFLIYGGVYALTSAGLVFFSLSGKENKTLIWLKEGFWVLLGAIVFSLPFSLSFQPMAKGVALVHAHSLFWQLLVLWGFFWLVTFSFWLFLFKKLASRKEKINLTDLFVFLLTIWATILIIIPEIVYVKDIYIAEYHRANTMFKLVYQAFILYALAAGYIFWRLRTQLKSIFLFGYISIFLFGFLAQMIYPYFAILGYYGRLDPRRYQGLYGINFLKERYPDDYRGVIWLKKNIVGQPVVLEAVGDSYTLYNRVSAMTGLPTVEGWLVHEWLWRGGYDQPGKRAAEVKEVYQGEEEDKARQILKKYRVKYIFLGSLEREKYPQLKEKRLSNWGKLVFSSGETKIYRLEI